MEFQEREICCCGARTWSLVIGWFEIVTSVLSLLFQGGTWVGFSASVWNSQSAQYQYMSNDQLHVLNLVFMVTAIIETILYILNICMNVVLLRGVYNKNPHQINAWRIFILIFVVISVVIMLPLLFILPLEQVPKVVFLTCVMVAVNGFFIWVVGIHKAEIEASTGVTIAYKV